MTEGPTDQSRTPRDRGAQTPTGSLRQEAAAPRGILGLPERLPFRVRRFLPAEDLRWCLDVFWVSAWDVPPDRVVVARVLPHPCVNLTLQQGRLRVTGVAAGVFRTRLSGRDRVFGVKFRPGAFRLLSDVDPRALSGSGESAHGVLPGSRQLERALTGTDDDDERAGLVEEDLRRRGLEPDPAVELIGRAVDLLASDPDVRRVGDAARRLGISDRTLQRLFTDHVGVTPGWVLRRGRLHAAAERIIALAQTSSAGRWADVAAEFGYADQAHFSRDFRSVLGVPPSSWAASLVTDEPAT